MDVAASAAFGDSGSRKPRDASNVLALATKQDDGLGNPSDYYCP
jgi:hypothetical protein